MIGAIYYTSASYSFGLPAPVGDSCDNDHLLDISFESDDTLEPSLRKLDLMSCLLLFHFLGRPPGKSIWAVSYLMFLNTHNYQHYSDDHDHYYNSQRNCCGSNDDHHWQLLDLEGKKTTIIRLGPYEKNLCFCTTCTINFILTLTRQIQSIYIYKIK